MGKRYFASTKNALAVQPSNVFMQKNWADMTDMKEVNGVYVENGEARNPFSRTRTVQLTMATLDASLPMMKLAKKTVAMGAAVGVIDYSNFNNADQALMVGILAFMGAMTANYCVNAVTSTVFGGITSARIMQEDTKPQRRLGKNEDVAGTVLKRLQRVVDGTKTAGTVAATAATIFLGIAFEKSRADVLKQHEDHKQPATHTNVMPQKTFHPQTTYVMGF